MSETTQPGADDAPIERDEDQVVLVIQIDPPIRVKAATYSSLTLKEPTGMQVRQAETLLKDGINVLSLRRYQTQLLVGVSGWPMDAIEQLPISTIDRAGRWLSRFTNPGRTIGAI